MLKMEGGSDIFRHEYHIVFMSMTVSGNFVPKNVIFSRNKHFVFDFRLVVTSRASGWPCLLSLGCQVATICYVSIITWELRHKRIYLAIKWKMKKNNVFFIHTIDKPSLSPPKLNLKCVIFCFMWLDHNYGSYLTCYKLGSNEYNAGKLYICYLVHYKYGSLVPC